ncbi:hypothetical protein [Archangium lipolyticum]|uniref:hypothetical protein n=1 Tax=Archangium lipolyticum TaxID=2970465 RepID=UPI00214A5344|nr:hypothetical protein [Archangium lipolyticum]
MKTSQTIPVWMLYLLTPVLALAQSRENQQVLSSPALWYWVAVLVVAAVAFAVVSFRLSKHKQPPHRPGTP